MKRGKLIVISAPSGCGKTTITNAILRQNPNFKFSVSATTRAKRVYEINGRHYYFLSKEEFERYINEGELVEWEELFGNYYGTLTKLVREALKSGDILLFDVDVKGGLSIKEKFPEDSVLIFIKPPDMDVLYERLIKRNTESETDVQLRLERVPLELELGKSYDFTIVNDDLERAIQEVENIIHKKTNN